LFIFVYKMTSIEIIRSNNIISRHIRRIEKNMGGGGQWAICCYFWLSFDYLNPFTFDRQGAKDKSVQFLPRDATQSAIMPQYSCLSVRLSVTFR